MKLSELIAKQKAIVEAARSAGREKLNQEEDAEFRRLQALIDAARNAEGAEGQASGGDGGEDAQRAAVDAERKRSSDIIELCRQTGMNPDEHIQSGATVDQVRAAAVEYMIQHGAPVHSRASDSGEENADFRRSAVDALLMRCGVAVENPSEEAQQLRSLSIRDMAIECMSREGLGTPKSMLRMSKDDLFNMACRQFFNPTAAFPAIMDAAIKKAIVEKYQHVPTTFQLWTSKGSVSDFKATKDHSYLAGGAGEFLLVGENGELKHDTPRTELLPERKIDTYGRQFSMSRQAFINDDIGFITEVPGLYAASAKRTINKQVYKILMENPAIFDGVKLFDAAHGNMAAAGSKPNAEAIQAMIMKMMLQTDPFGESIMVQPANIIVPVGYKFLMTTILSSPTINTEGNTQAVNPLYQYKEQLQIIEEGTINAMAGEGKACPWFMVGDKSYAKSLQVDYLNGQETPTIRRSEKPGQLGFVWDIWLDWGITAVDYRGIAKNPGVSISL